LAGARQELISISSAVITGIVTFAATNVDDLFILMLFFSQTDAAFRRRHIVAGQYLGFAALVAISLFGFFGSFIFPTAWIGLLGLLPIAMGVKKLLYRRENAYRAELDKARNESSRLSILSSLFSRQTLTVTAVTFANGGDNLGIYTPLFASSNFFYLGIFLFIFFALAGVWCYAGFLLSRRPLIAEIFSRYGRLLVPFVLVGLGVYILMKSGTAKLMLGWIRCS
jgi:cadmium resistance transport/sequestration family protein